MFTELLFQTVDPQSSRSVCKQSSLGSTRSNPGRALGPPGQTLFNQVKPRSTESNLRSKQMSQMCIAGKQINNYVIQWI